MNRKLLALALVAVGLTSCEYQKNNTIKQPDVREGDPYVYGVHPDSSAWQTKNKYPEKEATAARAESLRVKLFKGKQIAQGN
jgi:hypothetical protein